MYSDQNVFERILTCSNGRPGAPIDGFSGPFGSRFDREIFAMLKPTDAEKMNESTSPLGLAPTQDASHHQDCYMLVGDTHKKTANLDLPLLDAE